MGFKRQECFEEMVWMELKAQSVLCEHSHSARFGTLPCLSFSLKLFSLTAPPGGNGHLSVCDTRTYEAIGLLELHQ